MKLTRRRASPDADAAVSVGTATALGASTAGSADGLGGKGRPTPKRRESQGKRGPVTAPRTRKEAYARQKQTVKRSSTAAPPRSLAEQRAALRNGDTTVLTKRDRGEVRKLARDYVDSRRLVSNYLLFVFPFMIVGSLVPALRFLQLIVLAVFVGFLAEWFLVGRRIRALALQRFKTVSEGPVVLGMYAGTRAYVPRRFRMPRPQVGLGDSI